MGLGCLSVLAIKAWKISKTGSMKENVDWRGLCSNNSIKPSSKSASHTASRTPRTYYNTRNTFELQGPLHPRSAFSQRTKRVKAYHVHELDGVLLLRVPTALASKPLKFTKTYQQKSKLLQQKSANLFSIAWSPAFMIHIRCQTSEARC